MDYKRNKVFYDIAYFFESCFYNVFFKTLFCKRAKYNKQYRVSICGIFKNESRFLKEWIEYHLVIGVDHFYMYNNNSEDDYMEVLQPYIDAGKVTLVQWTKDHAQMEAYQDCLARCKNETQWLGWLDIDEFFVPRYETNINDWIRKYDRYPSVEVFWKMFGTGGKMKHDYSKLVIEQYVNSHQGFPTHRGKCFFNTDYDVAYWIETTHHYTCVRVPFFGFRLRVVPVDVYRHFDIGWNPMSRWHNPDKIPAQINHYWSKAWEIYDEKRQRTDVFYAKNPKKNWTYFFNNEYLNITSDYSIFRFIIKLKLRMKGEL